MTTTTNETPAVMDVREFADEHRIGESTAWKLVRSGEVESYRIRGQVRITREASEAFKHPREDFDAVIKRIVDRAPKLTAAQKAILIPLLADDDEPVKPIKPGRQRGAHGRFA